MKLTNLNYEDMSKLRRVYDAVKTLGMRDDTIEKIFGARNELPLYQNIENNQFSPLLISQELHFNLNN